MFGECVCVGVCVWGGGRFEVHASRTDPRRLLESHNPAGAPVVPGGGDHRVAAPISGQGHSRAVEVVA